MDGSSTNTKMEDHFKNENLHVFNHGFSSEFQIFYTTSGPGRSQNFSITDDCWKFSIFKYDHPSFYWTPFQILDAYNNSLYYFFLAQDGVAIYRINSITEEVEWYKYIELENLLPSLTETKFSIRYDQNDFIFDSEILGNIIILPITRTSYAKIMLIEGSHVTPARWKLNGFTLIAGILAGVLCALIVAWLVIRFRIQQLKKLKGLNHESPLTFQPQRRPTAVRSPSGAPPHYLKKSPSPTAPKPPPGSALSGSNCGGGGSMYGNSASSGLTLQPNQDLSPMGHHHTIKYSEENEMKPRTPDLDSPDGAGDDDEYGKLGTIVYKLRYLTEKNALVVSIVRCRGLPGKPGPSGTGDIPSGMNGKTQTATDPYVKLQLLPEKQHKVKTRVVRNTRNPVYDEDFTFYGLELQDLATMSLHFVVLSFDRYSRDDVIGEVVCPLNTIDLKQIEDQQIALSKEIQPRSLKIRAQGRGDLLLSLCWQPAAARLTVVLLKARNLPRMDVTGLADPYVKIYLLYNGQRIAKKKTHVKKRTLSPVFNESFAFDIPTTEGSGASLDNVSLELMLLDWDRVTKNEVIGRLELGGPRCTGSALNHWNELCNLPRRQIAEWHKLHE